MNKLEEFRAAWVGRRFRCRNTGEILIIPEDVRECDFFSFGDCFVDVGRWPHYSRWGGNMDELGDVGK